MAGAAKLTLSILGALLMIGGVIFTLQGFGLLGPSSGFMYNNSQWIYNGAIILVVGIVMLAVGLGLKSKHTEQPLQTAQPSKSG